MTETQKARLTRDWTNAAGEPVEVEEINNVIYAYGSELACLRLFHHWRNSVNTSKDPRVQFSQNLNTWVFSVNFIA